MNTSTPRSTRKVNKTPTEIVPEVKLQEPRHHKKYERNTSMLSFSSLIKVVILVALIIGAFALGIWMGFGQYQMSLMENQTARTPVDPMIEHCKLMPEMSGCEKYASGNTLNSDHDMMDMSMRDMGKMLEGKTGSGLEKAFLEGMIPHHEGAVEMAKYLTGNIHSELYKMKNDIITAQTKEIEQMKKWLKDWGYTSDSTSTGTATPPERIAL